MQVNWHLKPKVNLSLMQEMLVNTTSSHDELVSQPLSWTTIFSLPIIIILIATLRILYYKKGIKITVAAKKDDNLEERKTAR